jgi:hypothetical protein
MIIAISDRCHNDGDSRDIARFFYGRPDLTIDQIFQTDGRRFIDEATFMKHDTREKGRLIKVLAAAGVGKSTLLRAIRDLGTKAEIKVFGPTWIASNNVGGKNYQRGQKRLEQSAQENKKRRSRTLCFLIDEAGMVSKEFVKNLQTCYPYSDIYLFGDSVQFSFPHNALELDCDTLVLKNDINPRIQDAVLLEFLTKLRNNIIDDNFINSRLITRADVGSRLVISFTNVGCKVTNGNSIAFCKGQTIRCKINEPSKGYFNNELYEILDYAADITTLRKIGTTDEPIKVVTMLLYIKTEDDKPHWIAGQANTCFSLQGKTMYQDIVVDLDSMNCVVREGDYAGEYVVHETSYKTFLYTACSRVSKPNMISFVGSLIGYYKPGNIIDLIPQNAREIEVNDLTKEICDTVKSPIIPLIRVKTVTNLLKGYCSFVGGHSGQLNTSQNINNYNKTKTDEIEKVDDLLANFDHSKGERNTFSCSLIGILKEYKDRQLKRGFDFDLYFAWEYAQSIIKCDEAFVIWQRYSN